MGSELKKYVELPGHFFKDKAVCPEYSGTCPDYYGTWWWL